MMNRLQMVGFEGLAAEIIKLAVADYNSKNSSDKEHAKTFFKGAWFEALCDLLDVEPDVIRKRIEKEISSQ